MGPHAITNISQPFYYAYNGPMTLALRLALTLDQRIDRHALQGALECAARTYPEFSSRLGFADGLFYYVVNDKPVMLHDEERHSFSLGGADTNHYLYYVWAKETELGIICNHGIADARRLVQFATTLLYYYAARLGLPGTDVALPGVIREGDLTFPSYDPSVSEARTPTGPQRRPDFSTYFSLPVSYGEDVGDFRSYVDVISCKATDLRELAHRVCSRISPLVMALQAQAIQDAWDTSGKTLCGPITCDMRQCFDSQGIGNFSGYVTGALDAQLSGAPLETLCATLQRAMEAQLTTDALRLQLGRGISETATEQGRSQDEIFDSTERHRQRVHRTRGFISLYVSNVGAMRLPEPLSALVTAAECGCTSFTATYNLTMMGVGDSVRMTLMRTFADDTLTHAFASVLKRTGVAVTLEKRGRRAFPTTGRDCVLVLD